MKKFLLINIIFFTTFLSAQTYLLFGGDNNEQFLGCLNCGKTDTKSIWNNYGTYGSKYNTLSIWNKYGKYGGQYSTYSPFNPYTSKGPVIVDNSGNFYGHLSSNKYHSKRSTLQLAELITEYWEKMGEDPGKAYELIF